MAHQCPVRGTSCMYPSPGPFGNCWSRTTCRVWQNGPLAGRQQRPHRRPAAKNARPRSPPGQRRRRRRRARTRAGSVFPPSSACRAAWYGDTFRRNGCQYDHVNGIAYTAGLAAPAAAPGQPRQQQQTQQQSSSRSSNLNSNPSSSSSRRRPRGAGFSSQALPTSAGWLAAVGEAEADVEAPTRGAAAPGDAVSENQGSANR